MEIVDRIYGREKIEEPVLIDLINCPSIQRLKGVSQLGMPDEYNCRIGFSRYEHSLGVMILLRRLGAKINEQIAGLLHDVSHTAFSHVIDWIVGDPLREDHQDNSLFEKIENSELPEILEKYGFDYRDISNHKNFPLLERDMPSLCADRIDYSLREFFLNHDSDLPVKIYENLKVCNNQIVFEDFSFAKTFAKIYFKLQNVSWGGNEARSRYIVLSNALKRALDLEIISFHDLYKTDFFILDILENSGDSFITKNLNLLKNGFNVIESDDGEELITKFRYIDPEIAFGEGYKKLSSLQNDYLELIELEKRTFARSKKVVFIPK